MQQKQEAIEEDAMGKGLEGLNADCVVTHVALHHVPDTLGTILSKVAARLRTEPTRNFTFPNACSRLVRGDISMLIMSPHQKGDQGRTTSKGAKRVKAWPLP